MKQLILACLLFTPASLRALVTASLGADIGFSSSFSKTHPAHAGIYGLKAEFQAGGRLFFYSQLYLDYQHHEVNTHNVDFRYGDILQTGLALGLGGEVFRTEKVSLKLNAALTGLGLTYNPKFSSYGMHGRSLLVFNADYFPADFWGLRASLYMGMGYQYLPYKGRLAELGEVLLGVSLGFVFRNTP